jgi:ABC-type transport system involved in multi-copper enzyme maturation permease subunit
MLTLFKKELIVQKVILLIMLGVGTLYFPILIHRSEAGGIVTLSFLWGFVFPFILLARDQKSNGMIFSISLPVTRRNYVLSKYIFGWAMLFAVVLYAILYSTLVVTITGGNAYEIYRGATVYTYLRGFFIVGSIIAVLFPISLRYGTLSGFLIFAVSLNLLGVIIFFISRSLSETGNSIEGFILSIFSFISGVSDYLLESMGELIFIPSFVILLIITINYFSFKTSIILFKQRDL